MNKMSVVHPQFFKIALVCGVAALPLQSAMAGWNKKIDALQEIDSKTLTNLKEDCFQKRAALKKEIDLAPSEEKYRKYAQWEQRIQSLIPLAHAPELRLDEAKLALLDNPQYLGKYHAKFALPPVVIEEKELTEEELNQNIRALSEMEIDEKEKQRLLSTLTAQLNALSAKNNPKTEAINPPEANGVHPSHNVASEIAELEGLLDFLEGRERSQAQAKLAKLGAARNAGLSEYQTEEDLFPYLSSVAPRTEVMNGRRENSSPISQPGEDVFASSAGIAPPPYFMPPPMPSVDMDEMKTIQKEVEQEMAPYLEKLKAIGSTTKLVADLKAHGRPVEMLEDVIQQLRSEITHSDYAYLLGPASAASMPSKTASASIQSSQATSSVFSAPAPRENTRVSSAPPARNIAQEIRTLEDFLPSLEIAHGSFSQEVKEAREQLKTLREEMNKNSSLIIPSAPAPEAARISNAPPLRSIEEEIQKQNALVEELISNFGEDDLEVVQPAKNYLTALKIKARRSH